MMGDLESGVLWEIAKSRHREYLCDAAADRLSKQARQRGPGLRHQLTEAVGDHLIALGLRLKQQDPHPLPGHLYG